MESSKMRQSGSNRSMESKEPIITPQSESCKRARLMILKMETARHARQRRRIIMYKKRMVNKFCSINMESSKKRECGSSRSPESNKPISIPQPKSFAYSHSVVGLNGDVITTTTVAVEEDLSDVLPTSELAGNNTIILIHVFKCSLCNNTNHVSCNQLKYHCKERLMARIFEAQKN